MKTTVVHQSRAEFDVYIGRPSKWGNRHSIGYCLVCNTFHTRTQAIEEFEKDLAASPKLQASLHELRGKVLGCWCKPNDCHGDVLARWADK